MQEASTDRKINRYVDSFSPSKNYDSNLIEEQIVSRGENAEFFFTTCPAENPNSIRKLDFTKVDIDHTNTIVSTFNPVKRNNECVGVRFHLLVTNRSTYSNAVLFPITGECYFHNSESRGSKVDGSFRQLIEALGGAFLKVEPQSSLHVPRSSSFNYTILGAHRDGIAVEETYTQIRELNSRRKRTFQFSGFFSGPLLNDLSRLTNQKEHKGISGQRVQLTVTDTYSYSIEVPAKGFLRTGGWRCEYLSKTN